MKIKIGTKLMARQDVLYFGGQDETDCIKAGEIVTVEESTHEGMLQFAEIPNRYGPFSQEYFEVLTTYWAIWDEANQEYLKESDVSNGNSTLPLLANKEVVCCGSNKCDLEEMIEGMIKGCPTLKIVEVVLIIKRV